MKKFIINIAKNTIFIGGLIGTVVQTALFGSFINGDKYSDIVRIDNLDKELILES